MVRCRRHRSGRVIGVASDLDHIAGEIQLAPNRRKGRIVVYGAAGILVSDFIADVAARHH